MAKIKTVYRCTSCGNESPKWSGQCFACGEWNTMEEEVAAPVAKNNSPSLVRTGGGGAGIKALSQIVMTDELRYTTGLKEFDRVLGGGIVKGSVVLLGGDPGIGKSTLLLQICEYVGKNLRILYVSGEESARQLRLRADRLSVTSDNLYIMAHNDLETVREAIQSEKPDLVIIDSIQTMNHGEITSSPGSVVQVRECTNHLARLAKALEIPVFIVGHVNKDGAIAGPKVLEHIVDAVLYFEGERHMSYRILRAVKNRYGSTNEIGVFEMQDVGLMEVENPSMMLLSGRPKNVSGTCVACVMEGSRPILAEVQGLVTATGYGTPRRMSTGFDYNRMSLLLAVLEKRAGFFFSNMDAYLNIVGGLRLEEPAADLSVALALMSSLKDAPVPEHILAFGEVGLAGEIRAVSHVAERVTEAVRLGFTKIILPKHNLKSLPKSCEAEIIGVRHVKEAYNLIVG